jgi:hypothetical protein
MGPFLRAAEVMAELPVLGDEALDLGVELGQPGVDGADETVDGLAVVAAAIGREVGGGVVAGVGGWG